LQKPINLFSLITILSKGFTMQSGPIKTIAIVTSSKKLDVEHASVGRARRQVPMTRESLSQVFSLIGGGQRIQGCDIIRQSLNVNDFIAEWCVRHIEDQIVQGPDFINQAMLLCDRLSNLEVADYQSFLNKVFGIHGHAARGLLAKLHR